jgi:hypothetical protein
MTKREKFLEACRRLSGFFDYSNDDESDCSKAPPISRFIESDDFYDRIRSIIVQGKNSKNIDKAYEMIWNIRDMAFSIGFILGSELEVTNLETKADVEVIRKEIQDKALLPYLPRERKGGKQ